MTPKNNLLNFVGNTPLVKLSNSTINLSSDIYVKLEMFNPGGSIKTRVATQMVADAEKSGVLIPNTNQTLIEPTGGNTGIGLAIIGSLRGYNVKLIIPDNFSEDKINILKHYGADVILSDSSIGNDSHLKKIREVIRANRDYIYLNQFINKSNYFAHYNNTAIEILSELDNIDYFVSGVGSAGTITGIGERLKERFPNVRIIAMQPKGCDVLKGKAIEHGIEGTTLGIIPPLLNRSLVDDVIDVDENEVIELSKKITIEEGLFMGISSVANICASMKLAIIIKKSCNIVTIAPDEGRNYLKFYNRNSLIEK